MSDLNVSLPSGGSMPLIGLGTWQMRGRTCYEAVRHALDVGYRHIDTATMYGNEAEVGRALADSGVPRGDVFITTKLPPRNVGRERQTIEASLRELGTDYVDLWLIHWPPGRRAGGRPDRVVAASVRPPALGRATGAARGSRGIQPVPRQPAQRPGVARD